MEVICSQRSVKSRISRADYSVCSLQHEHSFTAVRVLFLRSTSLAICKHASKHEKPPQFDIAALLDSNEATADYLSQLNAAQLGQPSAL